MNTAARLALPSLTPPQERRWGVPLTLALLAHALLVAGLTWGVSWQKSTPHVVAQAELWSALPKLAAPRAVDEAPPAPPLPPPTPEPAKPPRPAEPAPPPAAAPDEQARHDADIALAQQKKKEQQDKERAEREAQARKLAEHQAAQRKAAEEKALKDKAEKDKADKLAKEKADKAEKDKAEKDRQAKEKLAKEKADKDKAEKDKASKEKAAQDKAAAEKAAAADKAQAAKERAENLKRIAGLAGASGDANATGTAKQSSGLSASASASYAGRLVAAVRPNIVFTDTVPGNPVAEVEVRTLPDGTVASRRITKSSGVPTWDEAVLKALDKTAKLPRDENGKVPPSLDITFRLKD